MLTIKNIHKSFGDNEILKGVDLSIDKGDVVVILGRVAQVKRLYCVALTF
ncbi:Amino acid ABC transporter ATP-binding protein OS=Lysinibacillus sphaericus OX=1421 GN=LS41612_00765 PE=4 SV=1 [Lysinibacillus sphaericus]